MGFSFTDTDYSFRFLNKTVLDFTMNTSVIVWDAETPGSRHCRIGNVQNLQHQSRYIFASSIQSWIPTSSQFVVISSCCPLGYHGGLECFGMWMSVLWDRGRGTGCLLIDTLMGRPPEHIEAVCCLNHWIKQGICFRSDHLGIILLPKPLTF